MIPRNLIGKKYCYIILKYHKQENNKNYIPQKLVKEDVVEMADFSTHLPTLITIKKDKKKLGKINNNGTTLT